MLTEEKQEEVTLIESVVDSTNLVGETIEIVTDSPELVANVTRNVIVDTDPDTEPITVTRRVVVDTDPETSPVMVTTTTRVVHAAPTTVVEHVEPVVERVVVSAPVVEAVVETVVVPEPIVETVTVVETPVVFETVVETVVLPEPIVETVTVVEAPVVVETVVVPEPVVVAAAPVVVAAPIVETVKVVEAPKPAERPARHDKPNPRPAYVQRQAPAVVAEVVEEEEEEEEVIDLPTFETNVGGAAHDDFNWTINKRGSISYSETDRDALLKKYDATMSKVLENEIIRGRVSAISGGDVVLDINYKSDGLVSLGEFRDTPDLKAGDEVEIYVESQEDSQGQLGLSRRKAKIWRAWESIVDSFKNGTIIRGTIISKTKGGLIAECGGLETFLPGSQIDIKPVVDYDQYVGKVMEFKVVKINEQIKNAVVSHKALIESDLAEQREQILGELQKGQVLEGIVKNITDFGAFLDLGGVDGLLYITDISWGRIQDPREVLQINQRINVVVLDFDENKKRISLGLKQLTPHPWDVLTENVSEGSIISGKIVNIEDYGAFVEIQPGVEGLIHISEITWGNQNVHAKEFFKLNQDVEARVVTIDRKDRKMSLSIKQLTSDPWNEIEDRFAKNSVHKGVVKNITNYGIFVELSEGVGGMVHISDLSWTKRYAHPSEFTKVGTEMDVIVLDIDKDKRQISLGHKQILENPWDQFEDLFPVGSYHEATCVRKDDKGAFFLMPHGLEAFAPPKGLRKEDGSAAAQDEVLMVKVMEFNKEERKILVSHTKYVDDLKYKADAAMRAEKAKENAEAGIALDEVQGKVERETMGDLSVFANLKIQLEDKGE